MDSNFEPQVVEKSQLVKASLSFQWIYAFFGLTLPSILCQPNNGFKFYQMFIFWLFYILYTIILFLLVIWMVYINNFFVDLVVDNYALDSITSVLSIIQNCAVAFVQLVLHVSAFRGRSYLIKIHQNIAQLEQDILLYSRDYEDSSNINITTTFPHRCCSFRRRLILGPGLFFLLLSLALSYVNFPLVSDYMTYRDRILTVFCFQLIQTKCSEYSILMMIVHEFISTLEQSLLHLRYEINLLQRQQKVGAVGHYQCYGKLMANQFLLGRIWCLVQHIEDYFAIPMLILFLYNGVAITHTVNWQYVTSFLHWDNNDTYVSLRLCFIFLVFTIMLWTCWQSQTCIDKFCLSITTYVVILIQFKLQVETEKANVRL